MHSMLSLLFLSTSMTVDIITFTYYMYALTKVDQYYILPTLYTKALEEILTCNLAKSVAL